ncbi:surface antigen (D15) [Candidatus Koribacter versatilis Ellin345]|uniref:Outer membrane protein assembly factor BamA n=1 Tax=Koribacter versatilis (strain Ellin345) TaxID=204669 RepID=Q1IV47_KORVE|nr:surface antigen (D15) [Candidatus Koribacter versatilis Ellin345]
MTLLFCGIAQAQEGVIVDIRVHGNRRIPADTVKSRMFTHAGDVYDQSSLERDFNALWNAGYFDDLRLEREQTDKGWIIHVYVKEKPTIREIKYEGLNSVTQSDVLDKFKERKVGLSQESQYDPTRVKRAEVVLKELLASHGRQFATIRTEVRPIPPAAVSITFVVKEGPKVKVGKIIFEGNAHVKARELRAAMKNLKPIGIPKSIFLENLFARTFDSTKLEEDAERVRYDYQTRGYFKAIVGDPKTKIRDVSGIKWYMPWKKTDGKVVDITMPIEEGDRYKLKEITFSGNKAISNTRALREIFKMKDGDWFDAELVRKGLDDLKKAYGEFGYINATAVPDTQFDDVNKSITLKVDLDEGKQFSVRRIEFVGNTTTRDKVIRRELALEEGGIYNSRLWEMSLLRLNQLQYFEPLKAETDSETKQNNQDNTIDLTLKVREKGKNSIGLTGGVSGLAGSFIGVNYTTNNLLGKGETLQLEANVGQFERNIQFGFTEPYAFDRPLQLGAVVFSSKYDYNYAKQLALSTGQQLNLSQSVQDTLQNYSQSTTGFTLSSSYPLHRSFKRVGLSYTFSDSSVQTFSTASTQYFQYLAFRSVTGPNALEGILTSKVTPSFTWNRIDNPQRPHRGSSFFLAADISGLGGNVQMIRPVTEYKRFIPVNKGRNVFGFRVQGSFVTGYGGNVAPPFERFYMGGENDLRGFDIRSVSPTAFLTDFTSIALTNPDGTTVPIDPAHPNKGAYTIAIPVQRIIYPGGDTSVVTNLEYRVPIAGPVTIAAFVDTGWDMVLRNDQLRISDQQYSTLTNTIFGCVYNPLIPLTVGCTGGGDASHFLTGLSQNITPIDKTNYQTRMSTGLELQVIMPIVNAPFRIYYAYNPFRLDTTTTTPSPITRSMFPDGAAGDYTYKQAISLYNPTYVLREPLKTFRFTVATTF